MYFAINIIPKQMIELIDATTYYLNGKLVSENELKVSGTKSSGKKGTIAYSICLATIYLPMTTNSTCVSTLLHLTI